MKKINLSNDQSMILEDLIKWFKNVRKNYPKSSRFITIGGFAGTGKTVLISQLIEELSTKNYSIACISYTGKATSVMKKKLIDIGVEKYVDFIGTIHSLMYRPKYEVDQNTRKKVLVGWDRIDRLDYDLIIIDESSMVTQTIWNDINKYKLPIMAFGDHHQLPPISGKNESYSFNLMYKPHLLLTKIHRQALNNPIIQLSMQARNKGYIKEGMYSNNVFKLNWKDKKCRDLFDNIKPGIDVISLCAINKDRVKINNYIREKEGYSKKFPYANERVICLKNNSNKIVMNGQLGTIGFVMPKGDKEFYELSIEMDDNEELYNTNAYRQTFHKEKYDLMFTTSEKNRLRRKYNNNNIDFFDFGYSISVHKSQGSEWDRVVLFDNPVWGWDEEYNRRWLYTAITRAKEKLFIISGF